MNLDELQIKISIELDDLNKQLKTVTKGIDKALGPKATKKLMADNNKIIKSGLTAINKTTLNLVKKSRKDTTKEIEAMSKDINKSLTKAFDINLTKFNSNITSAMNQARQTVRSACNDIRRELNAALNINGNIRVTSKTTISGSATGSSGANVASNMASSQYLGAMIIKSTNAVIKNNKANTKRIESKIDKATNKVVSAIKNIKVDTKIPAINVKVEAPKVEEKKPRIFVHEPGKVKGGSNKIDSGIFSTKPFDELVDVINEGASKIENSLDEGVKKIENSLNEGANKIEDSLDGLNFALTGGVKDLSQSFKQLKNSVKVINMVNRMLENINKANRFKSLGVGSYGNNQLSGGPINFTRGGTSSLDTAQTDAMKKAFELVRKLRKEIETPLLTNSSNFDLGELKDQVLDVVELMKKIHNLNFRKGIPSDTTSFTLGEEGSQSLRGKVVDKPKYNFTEGIDVKEIIEGTFRDITDEVEQFADEVKKATTVINKATAMPGSKNSSDKVLSKNLPTVRNVETDSIIQDIMDVISELGGMIKDNIHFDTPLGVNKVGKPLTQSNKDKEPTYVYTDKEFKNKPFQSISNSVETNKQGPSYVYTDKELSNNIFQGAINDSADAVEQVKATMQKIKNIWANAENQDLIKEMEDAIDFILLFIDPIEEGLSQVAKAIVEQLLGLVDSPLFDDLQKKIKQVQKQLNGESLPSNVKTSSNNNAKHNLNDLKKLTSDLSKITPDLNAENGMEDYHRKQMNTILDANAKEVGAFTSKTDIAKLNDLKAKIREISDEVATLVSELSCIDAVWEEFNSVDDVKNTLDELLAKLDLLDADAIDIKLDTSGIKEAQAELETLRDMCESIAEAAKKGINGLKGLFAYQNDLPNKGDLPPVPPRHSKPPKPTIMGFGFGAYKNEIDILVEYAKKAGEKIKKALFGKSDNGDDELAFTVEDNGPNKYEKPLGIKDGTIDTMDKAFKALDKIIKTLESIIKDFDKSVKEFKSCVERHAEIRTKEEFDKNLDVADGLIQDIQKKLGSLSDKGVALDPDAIDDVYKRLQNVSDSIRDLSDEDVDLGFDEQLDYADSLMQDIEAKLKFLSDKGVDLGFDYECREAQKALEEIEKTLKDFPDELAMTIDTSSANKLVEKAKEIGRRIKKALYNSDSQVLGFAPYQNELHELGQLAKRVGARIKKALSSAFTSIKTGRLHTNVSNALNKTKSAVSRFSGKVKSTLNKTFTNIKTGRLNVNVSNALGKAKNTVSKFSSKVRTTLNKAFTGIKSDKLYTSVSSGLNKARGAVSKFSGKVKPILNKAFTGIKVGSKVAANIGKGLSKAKGILSKFANGCKTIWGKIKRIFSKGASDASKATGKLTSGIKNLLGQILSFGSLYALYNAGKQAVIESQTFAESEIKLASLMKQRMGATKETIEAIRQMAEEHAKLGVVSETAMTKGAEQLSMYVHSAQALKTLMPAIANLTAKRGGFNATPEDAEEIATQLGEAIREGTTTPLEQSGIYLSEKEIQKFAQLRTEEERAAYLANVIAKNVGNINQALANTPHGAITQLKNNFKKLMGTLGIFLANVIKPIVKWLNTIVVACTNALEGLGKLLGFDMTGGADTIADMNVGGGTPSTEIDTGTDTGGVEDVTDSYKDAADAADKATEANEKFKGSLMGFDEINILSDNTSSNSGSDPSDEYDPTDITPGEGGQLTPLPEVGELTEADSIFSKFGDKIKAFMDEILEPFKNAWDLLGDRWKQEWGDLLKSFEHFCTSLATFLKSVWEHGGKEFVQHLAEIGLACGIAAMEIGGEILDSLARLWEHLDPAKNMNTQGFLNALNEVSVKLRDFILGLGDHFESFMANGGQDLLNAFGDLAMNIGEAFIRGIGVGIDALDGLIDHLDPANNPKTKNMLKSWENAFGSIGDMALSFVGLLESTLENGGQEIINSLGDLGVDIGAAIGVVVDEVAKAFAELFDHMDPAKNQNSKDMLKSFDGLVDSIDEFVVAATKLFKKFMDAGGREFIKNLGDIVAIVLDLAAAIGSGVIDLITGFMDSWVGQAMIEACAKALEWFSEKLEGLKDIIEPLKDVFQDIVDFIVGIFEGDGEKVGQAFVSFIKNALKVGFELSKFMAEIGEALILGLIEGIKALPGLLWECVKFIFDFIVGVFKELFGIHSPSTVFRDLGINLMEGLIEGIESLISSIGDVFTNIKDSVVGWVQDIVGGAVEKWGELKESITTNLGELYNNVSEKWKEIKENVSEKCKEIFDDTKEKWTNIKDNVSETISNLKDDASDKYNELKDTLTDTMDKWRQNSEEKWNKIKDKTSDLVSKLKSDTEDKYNKFKEALTDTMDKWRQNSEEKWNKIKDKADDLVSNLKSNIEDKYSKFRDKLTDTMDKWRQNSEEKWTKIKDKTTELATNLKDTVEDKYTKFKDNLTDTMEKWRSNSEDKWNNIKSKTSELVSNLKSDTETKYNNMKEALNSKIESVRSTSEAAWKNIKDKASEHISNLKSDVESKYETLKTNLTNKLESWRSTSEDKWNNIKEKGVNAIEDIRKNGEEKFESLKTAVTTKMETIKTDLVSKWETVKNKAVEYVNSMKSDVENKYNDLKTKIGAKLEEVKSETISKWENIKSTASTKIKEVVDTAASKFGEMKSSFTSKMDEVKNALTPKWTELKNSVKTNASGLGDKVTEGLSGLKNKFTKPFEDAKKAISDAISGIGRTISNANWSLPKIKLPHFKISGSFSLNPPSTPKFSVEWYKRGGIIDGITPLGFTGGTMHMGGEAGSELVMPLENTSFTSKIAMALGQAVDNALAKQSNPYNNNNNTMNDNRDIVLKVNEREFARASINSINKLQRESNRTLLDI